MSDKRSFLLYLDYWQHLELLTIEERGQLITAIFDYAGDGVLPEFSNSGLKMAFSFIRAQIDRDAEKWEEIRRSRSEAGRKGADARWGSEEEAPQITP